MNILRARIKQGKGIATGVVSTILALAIVASACAPVTASPAEKERVVKMGVQAVLTGPVAGPHLFLNYGAFDFCRYINDKGGLDGIPVKCLWYDTRAEATRAISAHRRLVDEGEVVELSFIDSTIDPIVPSLPRERIPVIMTGGSSELMVTKPAQWVFSGSWSWAIYISYLLNYLKEIWTEERPLRVGLMSIDYSPVLDVIKIAPKYAAELGLEWIGHETPSMFGTLDTTTEWLRLAGKNPDWVILGSFGQTQTVQVKDSARLEIMKKGIKIIVLYTFDEQAMSVTGKRDCEGFFRISHIPSMLETELPGVQVVAESAKKYRGLEATGIYLLGWLGAQVALEGVRLAIEQVGIEKLTGAAVRDALASLKDFDTGLIPPISMTNEWPVFAPVCKIYRIHDGKIVPYSRDYIKFPFYLLHSEHLEKFGIGTPPSGVAISQYILQ